MEIQEYTRKDGCVVTLSQEGAAWVVDQWTAEGDNRWSRRYADYEKAKAEFERWRD